MVIKTKEQTKDTQQIVFAALTSLTYKMFLQINKEKANLFFKIDKERNRHNKKEIKQFLNTKTAQFHT